MSSIDPRRRRAALPALTGAVALLASGCTTPAGQLAVEATNGGANAANLRMHTGAPMSPAELTRLADAFRAAAPDTVTFAFDSARLDGAAQAALAAQAAWLRANPNALMRIEGHADLAGTERYNQRLGMFRASAVATRLAQLGVNPARLDVIESFGETAPVLPVEGPEPRNRRAVTLVAGFGRPAPGAGFDGKRALLGYTRYSTDESEEVEASATTGDGG